MDEIVAKLSKLQALGEIVIEAKGRLDAARSDAIEASRAYESAIKEIKDLMNAEILQRVGVAVPAPYEIA